MLQTKSKHIGGRLGGEPDGSNDASSTAIGGLITVDKVDAVDWMVVAMNYSGERRKENRRFG